jgi:uncharacterized protein YdeI (YjbR/CyaY-like superfamily)
MKPTFFATPAKFQEWLNSNHQTATELWVGFHKKGSGRASITWPESVDEALCVGWIDGLRKSIDAESYMIRFTPRKARSTWSSVNIARVDDLKRQGRMRSAGLKAFEQRSGAKSGIYSYEQPLVSALCKAAELQFRAHPNGWAFFQSRPPSYRKTAIWWVVSAKKEETRQKRLATLISDSEAGRTLRQLTRPKKSA